VLETYFKLTENGTNVRTELIAGLTTFLTMAYIAFVNPSILAAAGMDQGAVFVATCVAAAVGSLIMGLWANYPIALAPGMGLNAFFAFTVVAGMGHSWETALGAVFIAGVLFFLLSVFKIREWIINAIPHGLKLAIAAGIGLFLALIGLKNAGIVIDHPATLVGLGNVGSATVLLAVGGFLVMGALDSRKVPGAITIAILLTTAVMADSISTVAGAAMGTSTTTSYIESVAGVKAGGRTGLTAVTVAVLFLLCLFFSPLAGTIPAYATAPALVLVACVMVRGLTEVDWDDITEYAPAVVTAIGMPLTFSIADGIGFGFITYAGLKILSGRFSDAPPAVIILAGLFVVKFVVL
jgi:AGZA family xanthine/uracil permease-like MFS transporter